MLLSPTVNAHGPRPKELKVLVVDDSRAMRAYIVSALKAGYRCQPLEARSGFEALRMLPRTELELAIIDINMPDINGIELIRFIRASQRHGSIPIVVVSTRSSARDRARVEQSGGDRFLAKPFEPEDLVETIEDLLSGGDSSDPSAISGSEN